MSTTPAKRTYTSVYESARMLGRLLSPDDLSWETELPLRANHVPLLLHLSCNAHYTTFIAYIAREVLKRLGLDVLIVGGPESCCGSPQKSLGDADLQQEVATKALLGFRRATPEKVLTVCPSCYDVFNRYPLKGAPFAYSNICGLFVDHLEALEEMMRPVRKRVVFHYHDANPAGVQDTERVLKILQAIPGLELIAAEHTRGPGLHCSTQKPMSQQDQEVMFAEASRVGAEALVVPYHSCYRQHVKMQLSHGVETHHYVGLLAMSLGIPFEEPFKSLRLLDDIDAVMDRLRSRVEALGYREEGIRGYVERAIFC